MKSQVTKLAGVAAIACLTGGTAADIFLAGNATTNLTTALNNLGESFTVLATNIPSQGQIDGLASDDILVWGQDGGTAQPPDLNAFLNSGGRVILTGGSNWDLWRAWALNYFDTTDTANGWHTDGDWHKISNHPVNQYLPDDYTFVENGHTYHMLAFLDSTPNSTMLGENDEPNCIAAIRDYGNGGSFNYMALDLGIRAGDQQFIDDWLRGALEGGSGGYSLSYSGGCPTNNGTVSWQNANPNSLQGLVVGNSQGAFTIPQNQPCGGTVLGIQGQIMLVTPPGIFSTGNGSGSISGSVGTAACNKYLQLVHGGSCDTSNVVQIQ